MIIRTPEDIAEAYKVIYSLKDEIRKIEKDIERAKNNIEYSKLDTDITEAVYKVFTNEGKNAYAEIDILHGRYKFVLSKGEYYNYGYKQLSIHTWRMKDGKHVQLYSNDIINTDYGLKLVTHVIHEIIFKRTSMLKKELKACESQDTNNRNKQKGDESGNTETTG